jgi:hypothetical protein
VSSPSQRPCCWQPVRPCWAVNGDHPVIGGQGLGHQGVKHANTRQPGKALAVVIHWSHRAHAGWWSIRGRTVVIGVANRSRPGVRQSGWCVAPPCTKGSSTPHRWKRSEGVHPPRPTLVPQLGVICGRRRSTTGLAERSLRWRLPWSRGVWAGGRWWG